jgi:hypothetical protein
MDVSGFRLLAFGFWPARIKEKKSKRRKPYLRDVFDRRISTLAESQKPIAESQFLMRNTLIH